MYNEANATLKHFDCIFVHDCVSYSLRCINNPFHHYQIVMYLKTYHSTINLLKQTKGLFSDFTLKDEPNSFKSHKHV